jgi:hypothetical protein
MNEETEWDDTMSAGMVVTSVRRRNEGSMRPPPHSSTPASFWTYQASTPTPDFDDLPAGCFAGDRDGWESLTPGMRREIVRLHQKGRAAA